MEIEKPLTGTETEIAENGIHNDQVLMMILNKFPSKIRELVLEGLRNLHTSFARREEIWKVEKLMYILKSKKETIFKMECFHEAIRDDAKKTMEECNRILGKTSERPSYNYSDGNKIQKKNETSDVKSEYRPPANRQENRPNPNLSTKPVISTEKNWFFDKKGVKLVDNQCINCLELNANHKAADCTKSTHPDSKCMTKDKSYYLFIDREEKGKEVKNNTDIPELNTGVTTLNSNIIPNSLLNKEILINNNLSDIASLEFEDNSFYLNKLFETAETSAIEVGPRKLTNIGQINVKALRQERRHVVIELPDPILPLVHEERRKNIKHATPTGPSECDLKICSLSKTSNSEGEKGLNVSKELSPSTDLTKSGQASKTETSARYVLFEPNVELKRIAPFKHNIMILHPDSSWDNMIYTKVDAYDDTGCDGAGTITLKELNRVGITEYDKTEEIFNNIGNTVTKSLGTVKLPIQFLGYRVLADVVVMEDSPYPFILGRDAIVAFKLREAVWIPLGKLLQLDKTEVENNSEELEEIKDEEEDEEHMTKEDLINRVKYIGRWNKALNMNIVKITKKMHVDRKLAEAENEFDRNQKINRFMPPVKV